MKEKLINHSLSYGQFYNSYELSKKLLEQKTYSTGTNKQHKKYTAIHCKGKTEKGRDSNPVIIKI